MFRALAPYGPIDLRDRPSARVGPLAPPFPDIVFASGRVTVPYFKALKRASRGRVFAVFLQDPRAGRGAADLVWAPEHDGLTGANVMTTLTSPHPLTPAVLARARAAPDARVAALASPRLALVLGGHSAHHRFEEADVAALATIAGDAARAGWSVMATPSRRTPPALVAAVRTALAAPIAQGRAFVWDGMGDNPYVSIMADADAVIVTADSVNMMGEALATGAPVQLYEPSGGHPKITGFVAALLARGLARRFDGDIRRARQAPVDATATIAEEVARRYAAFRASH